MKKLTLKLIGMLATLSLAFVVTGYSGESSDSKAPSKEALKNYDKDGDGKLSEEEQAARKADIAAKGAATRKANVDKYDTDGDGKLSKEEREAKKAAEAAEKAEKKAEREAKKAEKKAK
jgi:Ca2+-binding EF-hand superfamily protein